MYGRVSHLVSTNESSLKGPLKGCPRLYRTPLSNVNEQHAKYFTVRAPWDSRHRPTYEADAPHWKMTTQVVQDTAHDRKSAACTASWGRINWGGDIATPSKECSICESSKKGTGAQGVTRSREEGGRDEFKNVPRTVRSPDFFVQYPDPSAA